LKVGRLGLSRKSNYVTFAISANRDIFSRANFHTTGPQMLQIMKKPAPTPAADGERFRAPVSKDIPLIELRDSGQCKWTDSNNAPWLFCGNPTVESLPYCSYHCWRAYSDGGMSRLKR
jgi:hypothetical protein